MAWQRLSINEAEAHPLYGVKGWLRIFLVFFVVAGVAGVAQIFMAEPKGFATLFGPYARQVHYVDSFSGLVLAGVAVMGLYRSPLFGALIVPALLLRFFATAIAAAGFHGELVRDRAAAGSDAPFFDAILLTVVIGAVLCALFCWYFLRSRRVNVTYRYRVPLDPNAPPEPKPDPWARFR
ncbi:hypothetical protein [Amorphus sp. 3PC139-8]|uniref:hypothetical protein n=1 Tax=Amorphus sp. 3PC139-8 TaxID=2735676 RepID=UPI00345DE815